MGIIGFSGSRNGMTDNQKSFLKDIMYLLQDSNGVFVHGDCIGADAEAHEIAIALGYRIFIFPSDIRGMRAYCKGAELVFPPDPPLKRNNFIAGYCNLLIAAPSTKNEVVRSGTWATVRYARKLGTKVFVIEP